MGFLMLARARASDSLCERAASARACGVQARTSARCRCSTRSTTAGSSTLCAPARASPRRGCGRRSWRTSRGTRCGLPPACVSCICFDTAAGPEANYRANQICVCILHQWNGPPPACCCGLSVTARGGKRGAGGCSVARRLLELLVATRRGVRAGAERGQAGAGRRAGGRARRRRPGRRPRRARRRRRRAGRRPRGRRRRRVGGPAGQPRGTPGRPRCAADATFRQGASAASLPAWRTACHCIPAAVCRSIPPPGPRQCSAVCPLRAHRAPVCARAPCPPPPPPPPPQAPCGRCRAVGQAPTPAGQAAATARSSRCSSWCSCSRRRACCPSPSSASPRRGALWRAPQGTPHLQTEGRAGARLGWAAPLPVLMTRA